MGRIVSNGTTQDGLTSVFITTNTVTTYNTDENIIINPNGTGGIELGKATTLTAGDLTINAQGDLRLADADSSNYVAIQAPTTVGTNYTITLPAAVAARDGYVLASTTGGVTSWVAAQSFAYSTQSGSFTAVAFGGYFINTSSTAVSVTLPASPSVGDTVRLVDVASTFDSNALTVVRNGKLLMGGTSDMTVSTENAAFDLIFSGDTFGWRIFSV
jgi:hypothetical protein